MYTLLDSLLPPGSKDRLQAFSNIPEDLLELKNPICQFAYDLCPFWQWISLDNFVNFIRCLYLAFFPALLGGNYSLINARVAEW